MTNALLYLSKEHSNLAKSDSYQANAKVNMVKEHFDATKDHFNLSHE